MSSSSSSSTSSSNSSSSSKQQKMGGRVQQGEQGEQVEQDMQDMGVDAWYALANAHGMEREFRAVQRGRSDLRVELRVLRETAEQAKMKQVEARRSFLAELVKCFDASTRSALFPAVPPAVVPPAVARAAADKARDAAANAKSLLEQARAFGGTLESFKLAAFAAYPASEPKPTAEPKAAEPKAAEPKAAVPKAAVPKAARMPCAGTTGKGTACAHTCETGRTFCKKHTKRARVLDDDGDDTPCESVTKKAKLAEVLDLSDDEDTTDSEAEGYRHPLSY